MKNDDNVITLGDFNIESDGDNAGYKQCIDIFSNHSILSCDDLCQSAERFTYFHSLNQSSSTDHFFVYIGLKMLGSKLLVCDSGANLSDHRPLIGFFYFNLHAWPG